MKVSIVVTTYNWKEALEVSILSMFKQSTLPDEIVIADDGSREDTKAVVDALMVGSPVKIKHVWQKDDGFQLSRIRNKAIAAAEGDYVLMVDGDMVLEKHFVEDHVGFAKAGCFVQGGRVITGPTLKDKILSTKEFSNIHFFTGDLKNRKNTIRSKFLSGFVSRGSSGLSSIRGCNMAFWREDIIKANGFNEAFEGWGREDSEFVVRLFNNNIKRNNLKHQAVAYHLYHQENSRESLSENNDILDRSINEKLKRCEKGIDQYLKV